MLRAVDAPDQIAFMRFVPEVAQTSQVFAPYMDAMTFLTLVRVPDSPAKATRGPNPTQAPHIAGSGPHPPQTGRLTPSDLTPADRPLGVPPTIVAWYLALTPQIDRLSF